MYQKLLKIIVATTLVVFLILGIFLISVYYGAFGHLHSIKELQEFKNQTASLVLSNDGQLIGKFYAENRTNIKYEQLPKHLINALVATEDARYFEHEGIDSRSLLRVLFKTILFNKKTSGGGSTINQQLAKNMYGRKNYGVVSILVNKSKEAFLAYRLGNIYSKEEILTLYLNTIPFGENVHGIEAASRRFFNKSVEKLKIEEAAILIGILKANTYYNPRLYPNRAWERRNQVLHQMAKYSYINSSQKDSLQNLQLKIDYANFDSEGPANYFLVQVKEEAQEILKKINKDNGTNYSVEKNGLVINTTLDISLQNQALKAFKSHLNLMQKRLHKQYQKKYYQRILDKLVEKELKNIEIEANTIEKKKRELFDWEGWATDSISVRDSIQHSLSLLHAGLLAIDPQTGAIKTWIGGIDFRMYPYDQVYAQRQIASTFKPILYAAGLEEGFMPCSYLDNKPPIISGYEEWQPQNYDKTTGGNYSMAAALAHSKNIPAVNLFLEVPFTRIKKLWKNLGFTQKLENKPSTALGTANASIYELAIAYSTFANGGFHIKTHTVTSIKTADGKEIFKSKRIKFKQKDKVVSQNTAQLLTAMLQKAVLEGTGRSLGSRYGIHMPLAGKTGTSQDFSDAWFVAYNSRLTIVTRVGANSPNIHFSNGANGSGSKLALPLIAKTLQNQTKYAKPFKELPLELQGALKCEDYIEDSPFELFFENLFKKRHYYFEEVQQGKKQKDSPNSRREKRKARRKKRREKRRKRLR